MLFLLFVIFYTNTIIANNFLDIAQLGYEQYQDILIHNEVVKPASGNRRDCNGRYEVINSVLSRIPAPFSMIDIGASQGYYSFRAAQDYPGSLCVMIEGNNPAYPRIGDQLHDLCTLNKFENIIYLNKLVKINDLEWLSHNEDFDVVLALNIIHWFGADWQKIADAILKLGKYIIIETPPLENLGNNVKQPDLTRKHIRDYLLAKGATIIGEVKRHTSDVMTHIFLIVNEEKNVSATPAIKLTTFAYYNGVYPELPNPSVCQ